MMLLRTLLIVLFVLVCAVPAVASRDESPEAISPKDLTQRVVGLSVPVQYGGLMIPAGQSLKGPVVVVDGALDIQDGGVLEGDAWIVRGRLIMTGDAEVRGRVLLVEGELFQSRTARVTGGVYEYACACRLDADRFEEDGTVDFIKYEDPMAIKTKPFVGPGVPTRVQYNVLEAGIKRENPRRPDPYVTGYAKVTLPFWSSTRIHVGLDGRVKVPLWGHRLGLVLRGYDWVISNDYWQVSHAENALILVTSGWEFADYYERVGGDIGLEFRLGDYVQLDVTGSYGRDYSLESCRTWSLFNSNDRLPPNPAIDDGERTTISASIVYDSRREPERPESAWYTELWGEKGIKDGPGEFSYEAFRIDVRRYNLLPYDFRFDFRGKLFSTLSSAPRQVYQSLDGYGGVRGLSDQPFDVRRGDRLVLFSGELRRRLPDVWLMRTIFTTWYWLLFSDIGFLTEAEDPDDPFAFLDTSFDDWGKSVGLGFSGESILPYVGFYIAWDLDGSNTRAILRIERSF
jgi:hypothetical protein